MIAGNHSASTSASAPSSVAGRPGRCHIAPVIGVGRLRGAFRLSACPPSRTSLCAEARRAASISCFPAFGDRMPFDGHGIPAAITISNTMSRAAVLLAPSTDLSATRSRRPPARAGGRRSVVRDIERVRDRTGSRYRGLKTQNSLPSGSAIATRPASSWPMSIRVAPRDTRRSTSAR